jgi:hypothetical protein
MSVPRHRSIVLFKLKLIKLIFWYGICKLENVCAGNYALRNSLHIINTGIHTCIKTSDT